MSIYKQRIKHLQGIMQDEKIDICVFFNTDCHLSEYISSFWQNIAFLSGFTGSNATLIVTQKKAFLFTDGRYFLQAKNELNQSDILLEKLSPENSIFTWFKQNSKKKMRCGINFYTLSYKLKKDLENFCKLTHKDFMPFFKEKKDILKFNEIYEHKEEFIDKSRVEKLEQIKEILCQKNLKNHLISSLDDIAYLLNLRGSDIEYNPVFFSYLLFMNEKIILFINKKSLNLSLQNELKKDNIKILSYEKITSYMRKIKESILIDSEKTTAFLIKELKQGVKIINDDNPSSILKLSKNAKQISHIKQAMISDGVAMCEFMAYFEESLKENVIFSEFDIEKKLQSFRKKAKFYISDSFASIVGFNENGAIVHYRANEKSAKLIDKNGLLLIDSGAQYQNGTTDITRVLRVKKASIRQKRAYTLVLKAHIKMTSAIFPKGVSLALIDSVGRSVLWNEHLDYKHGTGHGVGYFLNVHEGNLSLSYTSKNLQAFKPFMLLSIEPGLYFENEFGIRLENLVLIVPSHKYNLAFNEFDEKLMNEEKSEFGAFYRFESLTLCPFEKALILENLLDDFEKNWLNAYHKKVYDGLSPFLDEKTKKWLSVKTAKI
ncbi:aminopeptidase P family protein [Campylobacter sp. LR286c]|uniref:aminopeptidase P family protein n=1 Tax=Campylobacter sp. LR286c TaxID=2593545 RepID=UPI0012381D8E|nr:aminopeptidase P family protein [Campylobacter sp. LR286c]KAA6226291.1 aminopeptidase P family protein [Campylobacter sp. LR286c]